MESADPTLDYLTQKILALAWNSLLKTKLSGTQAFRMRCVAQSSSHHICWVPKGGTRGMNRVDLLTIIPATYFLLLLWICFCSFFLFPQLWCTSSSCSCGSSQADCPWTAGSIFLACGEKWQCLRIYVPLLSTLGLPGQVYEATAPLLLM